MLSFALATQTCCGETVGREEEVLAAERSDFWQLRMHGSQFEIVVNTLDHDSHLKDIKSNPCWHFKMLPFGFRGNTPEHSSLCKAIIFHCKRAELRQFTPCSNLKEIQEHCCCKAWSWHTATLQPNSHCGTTSANDPRVGMEEALPFQEVSRVENSLWHRTWVLPCLPHGDTDTVGCDKGQWWPSWEQEWWPFTRSTLPPEHH